jgi:hypothetical protein
MNRSRRGTYVWLALLGLAVSLVILGGALYPSALITAQGALALLAAYALVAAPMVANFELRRLHWSLPRLSPPVRMTPAARKATQRAHMHQIPGDAAVTDVGLIVNQQRDDGQWMRHLAQVVTNDDGAIQPYISLQVPPESSNRLALVTFELYDQSGQPRFSHQREQWLRDGDNLVVCDRQLPLEQTTAEPRRGGVWDLRITLDGTLVAVHNFSMAPSSPSQRGRSNSARERGLTMAVPEEDLPVSLEALLKEQQRNSNSGNSSNK